MTSRAGGGPKAVVGRIASWARGPIMRAFRVTPEGREALVHQMLTRQAREAGLYWLQLVLAMAIATLGLVLGSDAVIIGAMLISPLMSPIVELGMGLAAGSPVLVVRAAWRVSVSVAVVVGGSALITLALPFHEVTGPIAARASPTALDLLVAVCCALMAAFATAASASASAATTAAGTAIAIALVPPVCVVGFGLGTRDLDTARGAALLFVANFCAILLFAVLTFVVFGYGSLDIARVERDAGSPDRGVPSPSAHAHGLTRLHLVLGSASGAVLRVGMPLLLLGLVYLPLRRALEEVAWEVRVRQAVRHELDALARDAVTSRIDVKEHAVRLQLVVVGTPARARTLESKLAHGIEQTVGFLPSVEVTAVADADTIQRAIDESRAAPPLVATAPHPETLLEHIDNTLSRHWPGVTAGALVAWRLETTSVAVCVAVVHIGSALGPAAQEILSADVTEGASQPICVRDVAIPIAPVEADTTDGALWLARVATTIDAVAQYEALFACVGAPASVAGRDGGRAPDAGGAGAETLAESIEAALARIPSDRRRTLAAVRWSLLVQTTPCAEAALADAGLDATTEAAAGDARGDAGGDSP